MSETACLGTLTRTGLLKKVSVASELKKSAEYNRAYCSVELLAC